MANVSHGMNIAEVQNLGTTLQRKHAETLRQLANEINALVNNTSSTWVGPDGERFRSWWPEKKANLLRMAEDLHGFGQSALNNVSEQRNASGS